MAERRQFGAPSLALAIAASVAVHAILLVIFVQGLGSWSPSTDGPITTVELAPRPPAQPRKPTSRPRRARKAPQASVDLRPEPPAPDARETGEASPPPAESLSGGARQSLRYLVGCERAALFHLTSEERRHCEDQTMAARRASVPLRLNLIPRGQYLGDPEPYLSRRPRNGCKVRAAGVKAPMGQEGPATGITCARPF